jgi:hypothetical protein
LDKTDYPYIRADGIIHRSSELLIESEVAYARQTEAPDDAWCRMPNNEGGWTWKTLRDLDAACHAGNKFAGEMRVSLEKVAQEVIGRPPTPIETPKETQDGTA